MTHNHDKGLTTWQLVLSICVSVIMVCGGLFSAASFYAGQQKQMQEMRDAQDRNKETVNIDEMNLMKW